MPPQNEPALKAWLIPTKYVKVVTIPPTSGQPRDQTKLSETLAQSHLTATKSPQGYACNQFYWSTLQPTAVCSLTATFAIPTKTIASTLHATFSPIISPIISEKYAMCGSTTILLPYMNTGPSLILSKVTVDIWVFISLSVGYTDVTRTATPTSGQLTGDRHVLRLTTSSPVFVSATKSPTGAATVVPAFIARVKQEIWTPVTSSVPCLEHSTTATHDWNPTHLPIKLKFLILLAGCLLAVSINILLRWLGQKTGQALYERWSNNKTNATDSGGFGFNVFNRVIHPVFKDDKGKRKRRGKNPKVKENPITSKTQAGANRNEALVSREGREPTVVSVQGVRVIANRKEAHLSDAAFADGTSASGDTPTESTVDDDE